MKLEEEFDRLIRTAYALGKEQLPEPMELHSDMGASFVQDSIKFSDALEELDKVFIVQEVVKKRYPEK